MRRMIANLDLSGFTREARTERKRSGPARRNGSRAAGARPPVRRRPQPRWRAALIKLGLTVALIGFLAGGVAGVLRSGWAERQWTKFGEAFLVASADADLKLRAVLVDGRKETAREALLQAVQIGKGDPILAADPAAIKQRLEALPWVKSARVERRLPDTVYLQIEEYEPLALWQQAKQLVLIDRSGTVIDEPELARFAHLPVIVGTQAPQHAAALLDMLGSEPDLRPRVTAAIWVGNRRWNLRLDNRIDVKLPEENGAKAWSELARIERMHRLLERDLFAVDLRLPDRLVVRLSADAASLYRAPKDDT